MLDLTRTNCGCYIDGHWGQYGASRLLRLADDLLGTDYYQRATGATRLVPGWRAATSELADEAESALNDATPTDLVWHWYEGDFFLSPDCGGVDLNDRCDDEACYCQYY